MAGRGVSISGVRDRDVLVAVRGSVNVDGDSDDGVRVGVRVAAGTETGVIPSGLHVMY